MSSPGFCFHCNRFLIMQGVREEYGRSRRIISTESDRLRASHTRLTTLPHHFLRRFLSPSTQTHWSRMEREHLNYLRKEVSKYTRLLYFLFLTVSDERKRQTNFSCNNRSCLLASASRSGGGARHQTAIRLNLSWFADENEEDTNQEKKRIERQVCFFYLLNWSLS